MRTTQWLFAFPGRLSVTISAGDRLIDTPREELAQKDLERGRERDRLAGRAAAVADRARAARDLRGHAGAGCAAAGRRHQMAQSLLAGDWTDTGLPATIEGAIRSGNRAADTIARQSRPS